MAIDPYGRDDYRDRGEEQQPRYRAYDADGGRFLTFDRYEAENGSGNGYGARGYRPPHGFSDASASANAANDDDEPRATPGTPGTPPERFERGFGSYRGGYRDDDFGGYDRDEG